MELVTESISNIISKLISFKTPIQLLTTKNVLLNKKTSSMDIKLATKSKGYISNRRFFQGGY